MTLNATIIKWGIGKNHEKSAFWALLGLAKTLQKWYDIEQEITLNINARRKSCTYTRERIYLPLSAPDCRDAFTRYILQTAIICVCEYKLRSEYLGCPKQDKPGKKGNAICVRYVVGRTYNPDKKYNVPDQCELPEKNDAQSHHDKMRNRGKPWKAGILSIIRSCEGVRI